MTPWRLSITGILLLVAGCLLTCLELGWAQSEVRQVTINVDRPCSLRYRLRDEASATWVALPPVRGTLVVSLPKSDLLIQASSSEGLSLYFCERELSALADYLDLRLHASIHTVRVGILAFGALASLLWNRNYQRRKWHNWALRLDQLVEGSRALIALESSREIHQQACRLALQLFPASSVQLWWEGDHGVQCLAQAGQDCQLSLGGSTLLHEAQFVGRGELWGLPEWAQVAGGSFAGHQQHRYLLILVASSSAFLSGQDRELLRLLIQQLAVTLVASDLRAQQAQNAKMVALGQMAAGLAHELNNPLGAAQLALDAASLSATGSVLRNLQKAGRGLVRAKMTTDNFLYYARGQVDPRREELDLQKLLLSTLDNLEHAIEGLEVEVLVPQGVTVRVNGHEFQQAFSNLILNARDATADGPERRLQIRYQAGCLDFLDNGPGVDVQARGQLFQPFFTTKAVGEGTGLGLMIARRVLENHSGSLDYVETPVGACFRARWK